MTNDGAPSPDETVGEHEPNEEQPGVDEPKAAGEDQTLTCVQCGSQFVFSADEQAFFKERNLHSPPKRCKPCRAERRRSRRGRGRGRGRMKEYRGPAFRDKKGGRGVYRSPAFRDESRGEDVYRAPAFKGVTEDADDIYRSPAFQEQEEDPNEIYRAPAFQPALFDEDPDDAPPPAIDPGEHDLESGPPPGFREPRSPHEIYRSPAFADTDPANYAPSYRRRQMHDIVCADCGRKSKVPFKPKKDRPVYCKECFAKRK